MDQTMPPLTAMNAVYRTNHARISALERVLPSLSFYARFLMVVFKASALAQQGQYDDGCWYQSSMAILRSLERVGVGFEIGGLDNIKNLGSPCVVVANHMSVLETTILPGLILPFKKVTFIVKESLMDYPVFKHILRSRHPIVVNRINPRQDLKTVLQEGTSRLAKGISVIVFPQTTRTPFFDPQKFNSMGVKLAARAKVPIIPLALMTDAWGNGKFIKEFGKIDIRRTVRFVFGRPVRVDGRAAAAQKDLIAFIGGNMKQWRRLEE